jgi:hypothetical protein
MKGHRVYRKKNNDNERITKHIKDMQIDCGTKYVVDYEYGFDWNIGFEINLFTSIRLLRDDGSLEIIGDCLDDVDPSIEMEIFQCALMKAKEMIKEEQMKNGK